MTATTLIVFVMASQIIMAAYLLYSFNTIERESKARSAAMIAHIDASLAELYRQLGLTPPARKPQVPPAPSASRVPSPSGTV